MSTPNTRLYRLAQKQAYERVPETCPNVHTGGTKAIANLHLWLNRRHWMSKLSEKDVLKLELRIGQFVQDLFDAAKEHGTLPLRQALVDTIHENMLLSLPAERIAAIEAGEDLSAEELLGVTPTETLRAAV
jgi:hypothetical protein